ncbi:MAG: DUF4336 domain-containing protein [Myxococcota bacterium]
MSDARLASIAPDVWGTEHDHFMSGIVHFRGRMTVVRRPGAGLVLHSVNPIDDALAAELAALGPVEHIIAPNLLHHVHLLPAIARYPDAKVWGAPGLAKKRADVTFDAEIGDDAPWTDTLTPKPIRGIPWANETVFLHAASGSLIVTDLVFNIHEPKGWVAPLVLRLAGAYRKFAQSRLLRSQIKDAEAASASVLAMLEWDFDRVIMAHGRVVETNAKQQLRDALAPMIRPPALASAG